jgi:hypothetical protein|tara:strand:+ start:2165 stop:2290 length:126 start_codon:yes stop_codon:yes gene_type:complete
MAKGRNARKEKKKPKKKKPKPAVLSTPLNSDQKQWMKRWNS